MSAKGVDGGEFLQTQAIKGWLQQFELECVSEIMYQLSIRLMPIFRAGCALVFGCQPALQRQSAFASEQKENAIFGVKITAFRETRTFGQVLAGAYYVFEAKKNNERE